MPPDQTGAAEPQADKATQPQAGSGSSSQAEGAQKAQAAGAAAEGGTDVASITRERDEARAAAQAANAEAAKHRVELKRIADAQKAADDAKLSESDKVLKRIAELERQNADLVQRGIEQNFRTAALEAATKLNYRSPEIASRLIDRSAVELAEDGTPKNIEHLLREILKKEPYLGKSASTDFGGGNRGPAPSEGKTDMNELLRAARGRG